MCKCTVGIFLPYSVRPKTWPQCESKASLSHWKLMTPIKHNWVITVNIFDRDCVLPILSELLEVPVYGPDQVLHDVDHHHAEPTLSSKNEDCSCKEAFPRKIYCYEDVHWGMIHVSKNFQTNILIGYLKNCIFPNGIFYIEILSLSTRDGHMKSLILTKVFHTG